MKSKFTAAVWNLRPMFTSSFLFILLASISPGHTAPPSATSSPCSSAAGGAISKFFILGDLLFVSANIDHFDNFRVLNLSSGLTTATQKVTGLLPSSSGAIGSASLLWAFLYDPIVANCRVKIPTVPGRFDADRYCARVVNMRGLVVARLSSQTLLFLRPNNGKFMSVDDAGNFLEMHALLKHLDKYGLTSSLTYSQERNLFVSTHYGRHGQICLTTARHQGYLIVPLPLMEDMLDEKLFVSTCLTSGQSYTSVVDLHGQMYAVSSSTGMVDQIDLQEASIRVVKSVTDKTFLNCDGKSPAVKRNHYDREVDLALDFQAEGVHSRSMADMRSMDGTGGELIQGPGHGDKTNDSVNPWKVLTVLFAMAVIGFVAYLAYKGEIDVNYWSDLVRDKANDLAASAIKTFATQADHQPSNKNASEASTSSTLSNKSSSRKFSSFNLSQWTGSNSKKVGAAVCGTAAMDNTSALPSTEEGSSFKGPATSNEKKKKRVTRVLSKKLYPPTAATVQSSSQKRSEDKE